MPDRASLLSLDTMSSGRVRAGAAAETPKVPVGDVPPVGAVSYPNTADSSQPAGDPVGEPQDTPSEEGVGS